MCVRASWTLDVSGLTPQVTSEHQVDNEEAVLVILESVTHVHNKGVIDLRPGNEFKTACWINRHSAGGRTSSSNRRSWIMFATAFILTHLALLMYFKAYRSRVCLCWTTRT